MGTSCINAQITYYVDYKNGSDTYSGTISQPFKLISKAVSSLGSNIGTIYLRGGTHYSTSKISLSKNGTIGNLIKIWAYENENPIIDFTGIATNTDGFSISGTFYHLKGLEIVYATHNGIRISGNNNTVEDCSVHLCGNTGIHITGGSSGSIYPSNNLILNCDAYFNFDSPIGGNADGFSAKWNVGTGNVFRGCRAFNNSDDGWDLWMCTGTITIENCIAFRNGVDTWYTGQVNGNGNGIKLGGNYIATPHIVKNCLAFDNAGNGGRGFDENNNLAGQTLYNCTAFRNLRSNYYFNNDPLSSGKHSIINCISYLEGTAIIFKNSTLQTNSWQGFTVSTTDFLTVDTTGITNSRNSDGSLPHTNFMLLVDGSDFVDAGTNVGIPYYGSAPDLGFCESSFSSLPVELAAFTATVKNENVVLNWQTATEINNSGFEIERSPSLIPSQREVTFNSLFGGNEGGFIKIGFVKGNGSTTIAKDYFFTDKPKSGTEFQYRLKQIDFDGTFKYSNIVTAVTQSVNQFVLDQNYPNPFNPSTKITYQIPISSFVTLKVYDILGNEVAVLVNEWQEAGSYSSLISTSSAYSGKQLASGMSSKGGYASGVYFYTLSADKFTDTKKFILLK